MGDSVLMDWLKKAPTALTVTVTCTAGLLMLTTMVGFFLLTYNGKDVTEFRSFVNTLMNFVTVGLSGVAAVAGVGAARSSSKTEDQTNGLLAAERKQIAEDAARAAVSAYRNGLQP